MPTECNSPNGGNGRKSFEWNNERVRKFCQSHGFQEYDQYMRAFRLAYLDNWGQWGHKVPEGQESLPSLNTTVLLPQEVLLETYSAN